MIVGSRVAPISVKVMMTVAREVKITPIDPEPLIVGVDPDALDALFVSRSEEKQPPPGA